MIRESIANGLIGFGRTLGRLMGLEMAVEVSDHSITTEMEQPDKSERAWDPDLYRHGNLFVSGYANPVKPQVKYHDELDNPNTVDVREGDPEGEDVEEPDEGEHVQLISSPRYRDYMKQDLISQLLTPESRWNLLVWGIIAVATLGFINMIVTLYATGSF